MLYVLVFKFSDCINYYVQNYRGYYQLNGLVDNAIKYYSMEKATAAKPEMQTRLGRTLEVQDVLVSEKTKPDDE